MASITRKRKPGGGDSANLSCSILENRLLQTSLLSTSISTKTSTVSKQRIDNVILSTESLENTILTNNQLTHPTSFGTRVPAFTTSFPGKSYLKSQQDAVYSRFTPRTSVITEDKKIEVQNDDSLLMDSWAGLATFHLNQDEASEELLFESFSHNPIYPNTFSNECIMRRIPDLREVKAAFIQFVASSLVDGGVLRRAPGRHILVNFLQNLSKNDPEFILKTAVYCRRELNIRTTANALLACACYDKSCYPFLDKYFSAVISLPSDWIEVAEYFKGMTAPNSNKINLPKPMCRNMISKFAEFDEYQLAKHNKEKARSKRAQKLNKKQHTAPSDVPMDSVHPFVNMNPTALTLKYLIRVLHMRLPTFPVMCILGKKYPSSATDFVRLGLEGNWDPSLSGTRMRLPVPFTWETELSKNGNYSATWESLITSGKLPYMAMLRNLRNIIKSGLGTCDLKKVAEKIANPHAVMSSNLFPFRFFTAYVVLDELEKAWRYNMYLHKFTKMYRAHLKSSVKVTNKLKPKVKKILEKIPGDGVKFLNYNNYELAMFRTALGKAIEIAVRNNLPPIRGNTLIICSLCTKKKMDKQMKAAGLGNNLQAVGSLLALMCASVCESSTMYVMLKDLNHCHAASDLARAAQKTTYGSEQNILEQARWLLEHFSELPSCSLKQCLEDFNTIGYHFDTVYLIGEMCPSVDKYVSTQRAKFGPLNAVWSNLTGTDEWPEDCGEKSNWMIMKGLTDQVLRYIAEASDTGLVDHVERIDELYGLTKPVRVQFPETQEPVTADNTEFYVDRPIAVRWRYCSVFVSSTFRDMHAERDLICGLILPALRQYAARELHVHLLEVDLRWGVPESTTRSSQALETCLHQASKADLFVLLVGNRYGWAPPQALLDTLPKPLFTQLSKFYVPGMSITEMEYNMAKRAATMRVPPSQKRLGLGAERNALHNRVFAFLRDPASLNGVPEEHALEFTDDDSKKQAKLDAFKSTLKKDGVLVLENYPAWFNGLIANRPVMGNLTQFSDELKQTLRNALLRLYKPETDTGENQSMVLPHKSVTPEEFLRIFVEPVASSIAPRQLFAIERAASDLTDRGKQCHTLRLLASKQSGPSRFSTSLKDTGCDGAVLLVTGSVGCGKTTHLASLAMSLHKPQWIPAHNAQDTGFDMKDTHSILRPGSTNTATQRPKWPRHRLLVHFADGLALTGLAPKTQLLWLLNHWTEQLFSELELAARVCVPVSKRLEEIRAESASDAVSSKDTLLRSKMACLSKLISLLQSFPDRHYAFLLDGADHLQPAIYDWLPNVLPSNVRVVLTCDSHSPVARHFSVRPDCLVFTVSNLSLLERSAAVRAILGRYGKVLNESGFRNQLSVLVNKRSADIPLYLKLACEELRLYGAYEELDYQLKALPDTIPKLVQHIVARAEAQSGSELVLTALALLACSQKPLSLAELHTLLDAWLQGQQQQDNVTGKRWKELFSKSPDPDATEELLILERGIQQLLIEDRMNDSNGPSRRVHIPSLAFHVLLAGIRPLLAGLGDEEDLVGDQEEQSLFSSPEDRALGLLRLRNSEVRDLVQEICFSSRNSRMSTSNLLGYHKPTSATISSSSSSMKRLRPTLVKESNKQNISKPFSGSLDRKDVYWLLATCLSGLEHKIYYFFHAGQLDIVCRLLLSPAFLMERLHSGQGSLLLEDFQGYVTSDAAIQEQWRILLQNEKLAHKLSAMRQFIAVHSSMLTRYPFLFVELAANYESDPWIRQLGLTQLAFTNNEIDATSDRIRFLIRRSQIHSSADSGVLAPHAVYQPGGEIATVVALSPNGRLIAYGTRTGVISLIDATTMREMRSFFGHSSSVLSLCFLDDDRPTANTMLNTGAETEVCLASTAQDKNICLWLVSGTKNDHNQPTPSGYGVGTGRQLANWTGPQRQAITCSAWHPERRLLATGSLDCMLVLWQLPRSTRDLESTESRSTDDGSTVKLERKIIRIPSSPVSAVAFRIPTDSAGRLQDEVAVACWNGTVRIFKLSGLKLIKTLNVSSAAICSLDYSCSDDGLMLATQDIRGQLFLWNSDQYSLLVGMPETELRCDEPFSDRTLKPWLPQHGQVCFSKPSGRYLIQSGGPGKYGGQITVWNAHLGAQMGPWMDSQLWRGHKNQLKKITACAADPFGRFLLVGDNEGDYGVVCAQSGRMLARSNDSPVDSAAKSKIHAAACAIVSPATVTASTTKFEVLGVLGFATELVKVIKFTVTVSWHASVRPGKDALSASNCGQSKLEVTELKAFEFYVVSGNISCVDTDGRITAVGSQTGFNTIFFNVEHGDVDWRRLQDVGGSATTSVAVHEKLVAFGKKNGCVNVYQAHGFHHIPLITTIHAASNDWITALAWGNQFLAVGSNDQSVRTYSIASHGEFILREILKGPGGHITNLSVLGRFIAATSSDARVRLWSVTKTLHSQELTTLNFSADGTNVGAAGSERPANVLCAQLFSNAIRSESAEKAIKMPVFRSHPKGRSNSNSSEGDFLFRIDVDCLQDPVDSNQSSTDSDTESESVCSDSDDSLDANAVARCIRSSPSSHNKFRKPKSESTCREGQEALELRLLVGQELVLSEPNPRNAMFRFRKFAPLIPQQRALLKGHPGLVASGLAAGAALSKDFEGTLVSVAEPLDAVGRAGAVGCDIRLWQLPLFGDEIRATPIQHGGAITSMCPFFASGLSSVGLFVSASSDGSVIFWRHARSELGKGTTRPKHQPSWIPAFRLICSNLRITALSAYLAPGPLAGFYCVCIAFGRQLWHVCLSEDTLSYMELRGTVKLDELGRMNDPSSTEARAYVSHLLLQHSATHIGRYEDPNGVSMHLMITNEHESVETLTVNFDKSDVSMLWPILSFPGIAPMASTSSLGRFVYGLDETSMVSLTEITVDGVTRIEQKPLFARAVLGNGQLIQPIEPISHVSTDATSKWFLVVSVIDQVSVVKILNGSGQTVAQSQPISAPLTVTALCSLVNAPTDATQACYFAIATSDGMLRLMERKSSDPNTLLPVGLCPTGERITKLQLVNENPLQLAVGTQSGEVIVYEIA